MCARTLELFRSFGARKKFENQVERIWEESCLIFVVCVAGGAGGISSTMAVMARNGIVNLGVASATSRSAFFKTASSSSSSSSSSSTAFQGQLLMPHLLDWKQLLESQSVIYVVRKKKQLSSSVAGVGCVAQIATTSSSSSVTDDDEVKEKKKKADAYFASDSRPIVLFDGKLNCGFFLPPPSFFLLHLLSAGHSACSRTPPPRRMLGFFLCRSWLQNPNSCCRLRIRSISFQIF